MSQYLIGLVIGALIAAFIYKDASQRGMNAIVWAIFGFLFGLITLIIYLIVRKPKQS
jgi:hypothetical protein